MAEKNWWDSDETKKIMTILKSISIKALLIAVPLLFIGCKASQDKTLDKKEVIEIVRLKKQNVTGSVLFTLFQSILI